ncbi:MAG: hypothetical protein E7182_06555 [Erysipelotrichaceae bacterium]|nr:hypothetical protein [Erysipelotrichaceae bacterium]
MRNNKTKERVLELLKKSNATVIDVLIDSEHFGNSIISFIDKNGKPHRVVMDRGEVYEGAHTFIGSFDSTPDGSYRTDDKLLFGLEEAIKLIG